MPQNDLQIRISIEDPGKDQPYTLGSSLNRDYFCNNFLNRIYRRKSRSALPLKILALSSAERGMVGIQSVPGWLSTNG